MRIFNKKVVLTFYSYFSIFILIILFTTSLSVHLLPMTKFVKSLIALATFSFIIGSLVYLFNEAKKKPVILIFFGIAFLSISWFLFTAQSQNEPHILSSNYTKELRKYVGSDYKQGYEIRGEIDDIGLMHAAMWQAMLKNSVIRIDFRMFYRSIVLWWRNISYTDIMDGKYSCIDFVRTSDAILFDKYEYKQGDIAYVLNERVILVYLGNDEWITSTKGKGVHIISLDDYENDLLISKVAIYRWCSLK